MQKPSSQLQSLSLAEAEAVVTKYVREACNHHLGEPVDCGAVKANLVDALSRIDWSSCFINNEEREALAEILACDWTDSLAEQANPDAYVKALLAKISNQTLAHIAEIAGQSFAASITLLELHFREGHMQSWRIDSVVGCNI